MIQIKDIRAGYPGRPVLRDVTLDILPSEVLAILGPNGCGKSTLLKAACGLLPLTAGEILLEGVPIAQQTPKEIARRVAYLPQTRMVPNITARRMVLHGRFPYLSYPRHYGRKDWEMVEKALQWVGAENLAFENLSQLSGGQRQKIYLAMALAQGTKTILMDEPTTYLDISCQIEVMTFAGRLAEEGEAVVMVLHDLCMAMQYAHRVALLQEGQLVRVGSPEELYADGILEKVMGVKIGRIKADGGWRYYYF